MKYRKVLYVALIAWLSLPVSQAFSQVTNEQRQEIRAVRKSIAGVGGLLRNGDVAAATKLLDDAEAAIERITTAAMVDRSDLALKSLVEDLKKQRDRVAGADPTTSSEKMDEAPAVTFLGSVAPIIQANCLGCHGSNRPRAGLRLDTLAGWQKGGRSGNLVRPRNPNSSLIVARIKAEDPARRMPQGRGPLSDDEIALIETWIKQGAPVPPVDRTKSLGDLMFEADVQSGSVEIPEPTGDETVSFSRDMAPWMANLCLNCHNSRNKSGGLSVETFYDLMRGGDTGIVILPGDKENSRFFRLVGGLENPRMPQGQARITRKNYEDMKKWFEEGNKFDGINPRMNLRELAASAPSATAMQMLEKSDAEMEAHRSEQTLSQLKRVVPNDPHATYTTDHFFLAGNVTAERLQTVGENAEKELKELKTTFSGDEAAWPGKLAIIVLKDRFSYSEFHEVIENQRADPESFQFSKVTRYADAAYLVIQDQTDRPANRTFEQGLTEQLTAAYLNRMGTGLPEWLSTGAGLLRSLRPREDAKLMANMRQIAANVVQGVERPSDIFEDGTFAPATVGPVGYTLVRYLLDTKGPALFGQLVTKLQTGTEIDAALEEVYGVEAGRIGEAFSSSLSR